ncbi:MAG: hypothetical protein M0C28_32255 [Candidatus Moduliflexus flocculans]|nr:hypothetical protein [Candidatus Moduliflexus flocculans]
MKNLCVSFLIVLSILASALPAAAQWSLDAEGRPRLERLQRRPYPRRRRHALLAIAGARTPRRRAFGRLRLSWQFHPRHTLSVLYAPLRFASTGAIDRDVVFVDRVFPAGTGAPRDLRLQLLPA